MCGIAGLQLRGQANHPRLGELITGMLGELAGRGPDSAGVGLYGDASLCRPGWSAASVFAPDVSGGDLADRLAGRLPGRAVEVSEVADVRVATAEAPPEELAAAVRAAAPDGLMLGTGTELAVLKGVGDPLAFADSSGLRERTGYQAVGHTRMATESAVTVAHSHPFSVRPDLCLVHNGSFANHDTIRRQLRAEGVAFETDNDSEVAAAFVAVSLDDDDDLEKALRRVCETFDGFYTLLATTASHFAVVRDAIACKPAVIAETSEWVAMASEHRALSGLPGIEGARVFEPGPEEVCLWSL